MKLQTIYLLWALPLLCFANPRSGGITLQKPTAGISLLDTVEQRKPSEETIVTLLRQGADLEACDEEGNTALLLCAQDENKSKIAQILLDHGANIGACNKEGYTPLHQAAASGALDILELLIGAGADIEARDLCGSTPLLVATHLKKTPCIRALLQHGAHVNASDQFGLTSLMIAACKDTSLLKLLLEYGADPSLRTTQEISIKATFGKKTSFSLDDYEIKTTEVKIPAGSTAYTFAQMLGGKPCEKLILEAWVLNDPSMEEAFKEWKKDLYQF